MESMSAPPYQLPPIEDAKRQYVELFGSALVMNAYLKIALLCVSVIAAGLLVLNFRTQNKYANVKPLVIRIDEVGRAQAVQYDTLTYAPQGQCVQEVQGLGVLLFDGRAHAREVLRHEALRARARDRQTAVCRVAVLPGRAACGCHDRPGSARSHD